MKSSSRNSSVQRVLLLTLALNAVVAAAKITFGYVSNSLSVRADGFHSLTDASNNLVGLVGVYWAGRPADEDHPYGHSKLEILAAGVVGLSLLLMSYDVLMSALARWTTRAVATTPVADPRVFVVLALTLAVNVWVAAYERRMGEKLTSAFLLSDAAHTRSDILVTLGVIATVAVVQLGYPLLDPIAALLISGFIAWAGIGVLHRNLAYLADTRALETEVVERVVGEVAGVASCHKIRTRGPPGAIHVDLHIQIARHLDVVAAHRVTHWVIEAIKAHIPGVIDVIVHTEPAAPGQPYNPLPPTD